MVEEGGNMAVSLTVWKTREDCLRYHSSRSYRQFVARTQHLLAGNFVVKIFKQRGE
jgi:heme-degrading monooxygenase HmoA